jgi:hypothetical protein
MLHERGFYLAEFDTITSDLDLLVGASEELQLAVRAVSG